MTDLNPEIWDNPTLGAAAQNENLERLTKQQQEDYSAKRENREPREVVIDNTYPGWTPDTSEKTGTIPSNYQTVHFEDEQPNDVPVDSRPEDETAAGIESKADEDSGGEDVPQPENPSSETVPDEGENTSPATDSTEENGSTKWT